MKKEKNSITRKCIISGKVFEKTKLLRLVIDPQKNLIPDLDQTLPGRGYWIHADRSIIETAQKKNFFVQHLKEIYPSFQMCLKL